MIFFGFVFGFLFFFSYLWPRRYWRTSNEEQALKTSGALLQIQ